MKITLLKLNKLPLNKKKIKKKIQQQQQRPNDATYQTNQILLLNF